MKKTAQIVTSPRKYLSVRDAAAHLTVSVVSVRRFLTQKKLTRFKVGGRTVVAASEVEALVQKAER
jgi:hypothetical protein